MIIYYATLEHLQILDSKVHIFYDFSFPKLCYALELGYIYLGMLGTDWINEWLFQIGGGGNTKDSILQNLVPVNYI